jgi:hypothetical protein
VCRPRGGDAGHLWLVVCEFDEESDVRTDDAWHERPVVLREVNSC